MATGEESAKHVFDAYSDYSHISRGVATDVANAVEAYSKLDAAHSEGSSITAREATEARARITTAATKLIPELESDRDDEELYDEILTRWLEEADEQGRGPYLTQLDETQLAVELPGYLFQFVLDIKRAAFEIGYLQAGRTESTHPDPAEEMAKSMFTN